MPTAAKKCKSSEKQSLECSWALVEIKPLITRHEATLSEAAHCELGYVASAESHGQTGSAADDCGMGKVHLELSPERATDVSEL